MNTKPQYKQLLLVGLDGSGKTTLIKKFKEIPENSYEFYTSTPYINIERIKLTTSKLPYIVYDLSGQVISSHNVIVFLGALPRELEFLLPRRGWYLLRCRHH